MENTRIEGVIGEVPDNVRVIMRGKGTVVFESGVTSQKSLQISVGESSKVIISERSQFFGNTIIYLKENSLCEIGNNARIIDTKIQCDSNAVITIGEGTSINGNSTLICRDCHEIDIGKDCMFSQDVVIHAGDAHPIYDTLEQRIINEYPRHSPQTKVVLGEHVWIGWGAMILQNTEVGAGSIIAARSLVKGKFPNNCTLAGTPAQVKRSNVGWKRYKQCVTPEEYMQCTQEIID